MGDWVEDIKELHAKFGVREVVSTMSQTQLAEYLKFRFSMLQEELDETKNADSPEEVIDGIIDLCVFAIGTLDAFGIPARAAWSRVHLANMAKEPGVKPERPNPFGFPDLIKPAGWKEPRHDDLVTDKLRLAWENL